MKRRPALSVLSGTVLQGTLSLHDVRDIEALCVNVITKARLELRPQQREDLLAYLISEAWILAGRYQPGNGSTTTFAGWATTNLRFRTIDWIRQEQGQQYRNGNARPELLSLDAELGAAESSWPVDTAPDRSPDLTRVLRAGSRDGAGYDDEDSKAAYGFAA